MLNKSRRSFIKSAAYTSALAVTGLAGLSNIAIAGSANNEKQMIDSEIVTLINHTASDVIIDNISGVLITDLNDETVVSIAPGEESSFIVPVITNINGSANNKNLFITDVMIDNKLKIQSNYSEFNGIYPASLFETA